MCLNGAPFFAFFVLFVVHSPLGVARVQVGETTTRDTKREPVATGTRYPLRALGREPVEEERR